MATLNITALRTLLIAMDGDGATMRELIAISGLSLAQIKRILATARTEFGMTFQVARPDWRYQVNKWGHICRSFTNREQKL